MFAVGFVCVWYRWKRFQYLLWLAGAFLLYSMGGCSQVLGLPSGGGPNAIVSSCLYMGAILVFIEGCLARLGGRSNYILNGVLFLLIQFGIYYFYYVDRQLLVRVYIESFGGGIFILIAAVGIGRIAWKPIDRILFWMVLIFGIQFFPRTILSVHHMQEVKTVAAFAESSYWKWFNFSTIIFTMLLGITLLATVVADIIDELKHRASTDSLTGLLNRRGFEEFAMRKIADERFYPVSLIVCDVDYFKSINDSYGHAAGDTVLKKVSRLLRENVRASDAVGRLGGEEFVLLLSHADRWDGYAFAERVRGAIAGARFGKGALRQRKVTVSFGVVEHIAGESLEASIRRADEMLYAAKRNGRNRTFADGLPSFLAAEPEAKGA
jgi:diguanylate cyclase (GGDEF)-like protein